MNIYSGVILALTAGILNGLFPLPLKMNKAWAWENSWMPFSLLSLLLIPLATLWITVPNLESLCAHANPADLLAVICCGVLVYTGSLLFGVATVKVGVGLSFALLVGSMNAVGVLIPRMLTHHSLVSSSADHLILLGIALSTASVGLSFLAGKSRTGGGSAKSAGSATVIGCLLASIGGILSGLLPVAMATRWSGRLASAVVLYGGAPATRASNAVLALVLIGGSLPNCSYCVYLLVANRSYRLYNRRGGGRSWGAVLSMTALYSASLVLWGFAVSPALLGVLGVSVGWAMFVGMIVISSTVAGLMNGEWKDADTSALRTLAMSLGCLLLSMVLICFGNYLG